MPYAAETHWDSRRSAPSARRTKASRSDRIERGKRADCGCHVPVGQPRCGRSAYALLNAGNEIEDPGRADPTALATTYNPRPRAPGPAVFDASPPHKHGRAKSRRGWRCEFNQRQRPPARGAPARKRFRHLPAHLEWRFIVPIPQRWPRRQPPAATHGSASGSGKWRPPKQRARAEAGAQRAGSSGDSCCRSLMIIAVRRYHVPPRPPQIRLAAPLSPHRERLSSRPYPCPGGP